VKVEHRAGEHLGDTATAGGVTPWPPGVQRTVVEALDQAHLRSVTIGEQHVTMVGGERSGPAYDDTIRSPLGPSREATWIALATHRRGPGGHQVVA